MGRTSRRIETRLLRFGCVAAAGWYTYDWWLLRPSSAIRLPQPTAAVEVTTCAERRGRTIQQHLSGNQTTPEYDVCVIGGGVVGLYTALDARLRGHRVILLEAEDFGCGSMSSGVGLVSGGFTNCQRALRQREGQFLRYAIETTREATIWCNVAPRCVTPFLDTILPSFHSTEQIELVLAAWMSSALSLVVGGMWRSGRWLSIAEAHKLVDDENLKGAVLVQDLIVDGHAAAIALAKTAERSGVALLSYCPVTNIQLEERPDGSAIAVITARDGYSCDATKYKGKQPPPSLLTIKSKTVVNCCGAWADTIRGFDTMKPPDAPTSFFDRVVAYSWLVVSTDNIHRGQKGGIVPQGLVVNSNVRSFPSASILPFSVDPPVSLLGSACSLVSQLPDKMGAVAARPCKAIMRASDGYKAVLTATTSQLARLGLNIEVTQSKPVTCLSTFHNILVAPTLTGAVTAQELYMRGFHVEGRASKSPMVHVIGGSIGLARVIAEESVNICQEKIFHIDETPEGQKRKSELKRSSISTVALEDDGSDKSEQGIADQIRQFATCEYAMSVADVILRRTKVAFHSPLEAWDGVVAIAKIMGEELRWTPEKVSEEVRNAREVLRRIAVHS